MGDTATVAPAHGARRFCHLRVSLRALLVLVLLLCLPLAWFAMQLHRAREQQHAVRELRSLGAACFFDYQMSAVNAPFPKGRVTPPSTPRYRQWLERLFGEHIWDRVVLVEFYPWEIDQPSQGQLVAMGRDRLFRWSQGLPRIRQHEKQSKQEKETALLPRRLLEPQEVKAPDEPASMLRFDDDDMPLLARLSHLETLNLGYTYITDASLSRLAALRHLTELRLQGTDVGDEGMAHIGKLTQLRELHLNYTQVTDAGLEHARNLENLEKLLIWGTKIGDPGVRHISSLMRLRVLFLDETQVTDEGISYLESMPRLEHVSLHRTRVTDDCIRSLGEALPNCKISH